MWLPIVWSSAASYFVNKLLRRSLLPTRCDLDLDFQKQGEKSLLCLKKKKAIADKTHGKWAYLTFPGVWTNM